MSLLNQNKGKDKREKKTSHRDKALNSFKNLLPRHKVAVHRNRIKQGEAGEAKQMDMTHKLKALAAQLDGELYDDVTMRTLYATDASAYREMPLAVAIPASIEDLKRLIEFANKEYTSLIPRTAGTSLAGQVVGNGIVVDVSKTFTKIIEINVEERWVRVQPGVIRDELNLFLKPHGLFFGPETSTANRAMIGGMVGNNSCGSNSIVMEAPVIICLK
jgi:FAD/FMN-containing dehydrogenase